MKRHTLYRNTLILVLSFFLFPHTVSAQENIRKLERLDADSTEHIVILVSGWQVGGFCLFEQLDVLSQEKIVNALTGLNIDLELADIIANDPCSSDFVPWNTFRDMSAHFLTPDSDEILNSNSIAFTNYPLASEQLLGTLPEVAADSKVVYYSYTGNYKKTKVALGSQGEISEIVRGEDCSPAEQLNPPDAEGFQCHPSYTLNDTSIIIQRNDQGLNFFETIFAEFIRLAADGNELQQFINSRFSDVNISASIFDPTNLNNDAQRASIHTTYFDHIAGQAVKHAYEEFGVFNEDVDSSPQKLLFDNRAEHMQQLVNDVVNHYKTDDTNVEITIVGHSQGGLVATYWAGWDGSNSIEPDTSTINAVVTLDSPLGGKISLEGVYNSLKDLKIPSVPILNIEPVIIGPFPLAPDINVPFMNSPLATGVTVGPYPVFPGAKLDTPEIHIGDYISQDLTRYNVRLFYGLEPTVNRAPSRVPLYTIRNEKDMFVVADHAYPGVDGGDELIIGASQASRRNGWHDKVINYDWNEYPSQNKARIQSAYPNFQGDGNAPIGVSHTINHAQVKDDVRISKDVQFAIASGSIYKVTRSGREAIFTQGAITDEARLSIHLARPAYNSLYEGVTQADFQVELVPTTTPNAECSSPNVLPSHRLNVLGAFDLDNHSEVNDFSGNDFSKYSAELQGPATILHTAVPTNLQAGCYDAVVTYGENNDALRATRSTLYRAVQVTNEPEIEAANAGIVVVLDTSGSMSGLTETGNPKYIEVANAAKFLVQLVFQDISMRLGMLEFSSSSSKIYPTSGDALSPVTNANLNLFLDNIDAKLYPSGGTYVTAALIEAARWLEADPADVNSKAIVILTDGSSADSWSANRAAFALNYPHIPVYTIGYGRNSGAFDEFELRQIAEDTGGFYRYAPDVNALRQIYESIRELVTGLNGFDQPGQSIQPAETTQIRFNVDPALSDMKLVLSWNPQELATVDISLTAPDGTQINEQNIATALPGGSILTSGGSWIFSLSSTPQAGEWALAVAGDQISATGGAINISTSTQSAIHLEDTERVIGSRVGARLSAYFSLVDLNPDWEVQAVENAEGTVTLPSGTQHRIDIFDDGFHEDGTANDLHFAAVVPASLVTEPGQYNFEVKVSGRLAQQAPNIAAASVENDPISFTFTRVFNMQRSVETIQQDNTIANLSVMVTEKPGSAGQYCVTYANQGPGDATDVSLLVGVDNGAVIGASVGGERHLKGFTYGWNLGSIPAGESGFIETLALPIDKSQPMKVVGYISSGILNSASVGGMIDNVGGDNISTYDGTETTQQLNAGWNLVGLAEHPTSGSPDSILCGSNAEVDVILGYDRGGLTYDPNFDNTFNTLRTMNGLDSYWVRTSQPGQIRVGGVDVSAQTPIEMSQGWNMITFLPQTQQTVADALSSIDGYYTTVLGYAQGGMSYYSDIPAELATLQKLEPNMGYLVYMKQSATLVYDDQPSSQVSAAANNAINSPQRPSGVALSNSWMNLYVAGLWVHGQPAMAGSMVEVFTESGLRVGEGRMNQKGQTLISVYGDDSYTNNVDGARSNEALVVKINGEEAVLNDGSRIQWTGMGTLERVELFVGEAKRSIENLQFLFLPIALK